MRTLSAKEKEARLAMLDEMRAMMNQDIDPLEEPGAKATVIAEDPESLQEGLEAATELMDDIPDMEEMDMLSDEEEELEEVESKEDLKAEIERLKAKLDAMDEDEEAFEDL